MTNRPVAQPASEVLTPELILIGGASGSGKTTLAALLRSPNLGSAWVETDRYFIDEDGVYTFKRDLLGAAHAATQQRVADWMAMQLPHIIVSNTFTQRWERQPYIALAQANGYRVTWIAIKTDLTAEELATRNTHGVPADVIRRQLERWED